MKKAFTLAEMLIVLGIVGVVAALAIPSLYNHFKKIELHTRFNKTYSVVNQALNLTMGDLGLTSSSDFGIYWNEDKNVLNQRFVDINKIWDSKFAGATLTDKQDFSRKRVYMHDFWGDLWPYAMSWPVNGTYQDNNFLILPDGAMVSRLGYNTIGYPSSLALVIFFDTNGPYRGPNRIGYDMFYYYQDGKYHEGNLVPTCDPLRTPINPYWQSMQHSACSAIALKDINPYDSSKKYWDSLYKPKSWWENLKNNKDK